MGDLKVFCFKVLRVACSERQRKHGGKYSCSEVLIQRSTHSVDYSFSEVLV